jgi:hypothetical protein
LQGLRVLLGFAVHNKRKKQISVVFSLNVTLWPRACLSSTVLGGKSWNGTNNLAQEGFPISFASDLFMIPAVWMGNTSEVSDVLLCQSFCADQDIPPDAIISGVRLNVAGFSDVAGEVSVISVSFYEGLSAITSATPLTPSLPFALPQLLVSTYYDLSFAKLQPFATVFGSSSDSWQLGGSASLLLRPEFGVGLTVSKSSVETGLQKAHVFSVSVEVFFRTSDDNFVPPYSSCPTVQDHDPDLSARSFSCANVTQAQCRIDSTQSYGIISAHCESQPAPNSTIPILISSGGACLGQV